MNTFYADLAEIMEIDEIDAQSVLRDYAEWDSLTVLSLVARVRQQYGLTLTANDLRPIETAKDLHDLIEEGARARQ
jgi:acyl carrier protein